MGGIRPKQLARIGEFHLEEAVLDALLGARHENECLGPAEISKRAGIHRGQGPRNTINDAIVKGMLNKLAEQGRVKRCKQSNKRDGWKMTGKEFAIRRDDILE